MERLALLALVGLAAQLVDGALGMAYGLTSTTLLLTVGVAPASASATVHLAELATTAASGVSHWRFGNVDWRVVRLMALPGAVGAFIGAVFLSSLPAEVAAPMIAGFLLLLGLYVLARFARPGERSRGPRRPLPAIFLSPLGAVAGFMDAAGGGGWGPIGTPTLLSSGRLAPRRVVGSIDTSEFLVALGASAGFLLSLSFSAVHLEWVGALVAGGLVAAPIAAWLVRHLPARILGTAVGAVIVLTNARILGTAAGVPGRVLAAAYLLLAATALAALASALVQHRRERSSIRGRELAVEPA